MLVELGELDLMLFHEGKANILPDLVIPVEHHCHPKTIRVLRPFPSRDGIYDEQSSAQFFIGILEKKDRIMKALTFYKSIKNIKMLPKIPEQGS